MHFRIDSAGSEPMVDGGSRPRSGQRSLPLVVWGAESVDRERSILTSSQRHSRSLVLEVDDGGIGSWEEEIHMARVSPSHQVRRFPVLMTKFQDFAVSIVVAHVMSFDDDSISDVCVHGCSLPRAEDSPPWSPPIRLGTRVRSHRNPGIGMRRRSFQGATSWGGVATALASTHRAAPRSPGAGTRPGHCT